MKRKIEKFIVIVIFTVLITGIMTFSGCSVQEQSVKDSASYQSDSIGSLKSVLGNAKIVAIAGGSEFSLAISSDGRLWATGDNSYGQLGLGPVLQVNFWTLVPGMDHVTDIACGHLHSLILRDRSSLGGTYGEVWSTGSNKCGQLGFGDAISRNVFNYTYACYASSIAAGYEHSMLISGGTVWETGRNSEGQLGFGNMYNIYTGFTMVPNLSGVTAIAAGNFHSLYLKSGKVWATGQNAWGQLGMGNTNQIYYTRWTPVPGIDNVTSIACGGLHSLILRDRRSQGGTYGEVWATGLNNHGQLGFGDNYDRNSFQYTYACYASSIVAGTYHSLLISGGTIWATGDNYFGQLGFGDNNNRNGFNFTGFRNCSAIAAGENFSLSLQNGKVWATGTNTLGELGQGNTNKYNKFTLCP